MNTFEKKPITTKGFPKMVIDHLRREDDHLSKMFIPSKMVIEDGHHDHLRKYIDISRVFLLFSPEDVHVAGSIEADGNS